MSSQIHDPEFASQLARAYGGELPPHVIYCKSPMSAYYARIIFRELTNETKLLSLVHRDTLNDPRLAECLRVPPLVRMLIHSTWHAASQALRGKLEECVKSHARECAENLLSESSYDLHSDLDFSPSSSRRGSPKDQIRAAFSRGQDRRKVAGIISSEIANCVWATVEAMLSHPDMLGLELAVGNDLDCPRDCGEGVKLARGVLCPDEPQAAALDNADYYLRGHPDTLDLRSVFNARAGSKQSGFSSSPPGHNYDDSLSGFCFICGSYEMKGDEFVRVRNKSVGKKMNPLGLRALSGAYFPHKNFCWVGDVAERIILEENLNGTTVKLEYGDGWRFAVEKSPHVHLPRLGGQPSLFEILGEPKLDLQRKMISDYGAKRFLENVNARIVHSDDYGKLWKSEHPLTFTSGGSAYRIEGFAFVEVVNSTAEPDGTFKDHFIRVPHNVRTAREAVAWTFEKDGRDYRPTAQT